MKRFLVACFGLLFIQNASANASGMETISRLTCVDTSPSGIARQSWSPGGTPYGVPLTEWGQQEFALLRTRIADCAKQSGTDARGLLAYVQRLEGMTRSQNVATDPVRRQVSVDEAHRRSEALNEAMGQAQKRAYEAEKGVERGLLDKVGAFTSSAELKAFCSETWKSPLPDATRADVAARCQQKLQILAMADQQADEARHAQASASELSDLIRKVREMPATQETVSQLRYLGSDNHYRLPSLTYPDQNRYVEAIDGRLNELNKHQADVACSGVVSRIAVPEAVRDALVIDGLGGISMAQFLCGPVLTARNVSVRLADQDLVEIKVEAFTLTFAHRRYLSDDKVDVALDSPIKGGVNALVLVGAAEGGSRLAIGNPNFFVINFYSQFTPQVSAFLKQQPFQSDASAPPAPKAAAAAARTPAASPENFIRVNCQMGECTWSALSQKSVVKEVAGGKLVRATMRQCETSNPDGEYPEHYACRPKETELAEYVAFCSAKDPSIAYKEGGKWQRTRLSISDDGQFGYNTESITQYLRICHDYVRGPESLDAVGARFGYKSRISALGDNAQDAVEDILQLAE